MNAEILPYKAGEIRTWVMVEHVRKMIYLPIEAYELVDGYGDKSFAADWIERNLGYQVDALEFYAPGYTPDWLEL